MIATLNNNLEAARRQMMLNAIGNLKDTIILCYGVGEYPASNFGDKEVEELFYNANAVAVRMHEEKSNLEGEDE